MLSKFIERDADKISTNKMKIEELKKEYDKLQIKYGAKQLDSIYNGGCEENPNVCFVFMNPTGKNIASDKSWEGRKSPWLGTKNIWKLFYKVNLLSEDILNQINEKKPKDWDYQFCDYVYDEISKNKVFITNLGKCTQIDARPLPNEVLKKYLDLLFKEINIIKPKIIITFALPLMYDNKCDICNGKALSPRRCVYRIYC